jgi:hypothetical protein
VLGLLAALTLDAAAASVRLIETWRDRRFCVVEDGERFCDILTRGTFRVIGSFAWSDPSLATNITAETEFTFLFGSAELAFSPNDDPKWKPGKRVVTQVFTHENDRGRTVRDGIAILRWNKKGFVITYIGKSGDALNPVVADGFYTSEPGPISDNTTFGFDVSLGTYNTNGLVLVTGLVTQKVVGPPDDQNTLTGVAVKGKIAPTP